MIPGNNHITEDLLVKYLLGEGSGEEQEQVQHWLGENEENRKEYYRFKTVWEESRYVAAGSSVNEDVAWGRFMERARERERKTIPLPGRYNWLKVAAVLLVVAGSGWLTYNKYFTKYEPNVVITEQAATPPVNMRLPEKAPINEATATEQITDVAEPAAKTVSSPPTEKQPVAIAANVTNGKKFLNVAYEPTMNSRRTKEYICNATPCPLEICIIQKVKCNDGEPRAISTCSVLEPDRSGQLHYKAFDQITKNCDTDVEEIRIKRVSTGETIVLNAYSKPATAQDFFSYITGDKKGDILAGMFHKDCNNRSDDCGLVFNNDYGSIILQ